MKLHIFNPDHDLALAANLPRFTAPHAGRQLRADLSFIPALWADEGDLVLVDDIDCARDKFRHLCGQGEVGKVEFVTRLQLEKIFADTFLVDSIHPWGWNLALRHELLRLGCPSIMLPADDTLARLRLLSSRQWAAEHLQEHVDYVRSVEEMRRSVEAKGKAVVKAPWSSSGRGVRFVDGQQLGEGDRLSPLERWAANVMGQQGGLTVEPYYNKVRDFGMEFVMADGKMKYCGLSLFQTVKNAYTGNLLATEQEKMEMLAAYRVGEADLALVRKLLVERLELHLRNVYAGPFGVDMMVCADERAEDARLFVNPCVELNLRCTMGHVALALGGKSFGPAAHHVMRVEYDGNRYHLRLLPGSTIEPNLH